MIENVIENPNMIIACAFCAVVLLQAYMGVIYIFKYFLSFIACISIVSRVRSFMNHTYVKFPRNFHRDCLSDSEIAAREGGNK